MIVSGTCSMGEERVGWDEIKANGLCYFEEGLRNLEDKKGLIVNSLFYPCFLVLIRLSYL